ncbi:amidophosphoribosyltransferase [Marinicella meishanensis]|uniref:amidophosphoribosyltransferase n=1 Tax=Marinicella meishanensis TaxID=2873263 RepID=UPI001CBC4CC0|nr:amidophosphoribosyltransferase [Marinicella sp. NBU2979]
MCGIVGMIGNHDVASTIYECLTILQHRGQDAAGIATCEDGKLELVKNNGLVSDVFRSESAQKLKGLSGIGHVRYPTAGSSNFEEAQPFYVNSPFGIALAHNGNLHNAEQLQKELFAEDRRHINTQSDSEVLLNVFAHELQNASGLVITPEAIFHAVSRVHKRCQGAYANVLIIPGYGIVAFRDPNGIRPLVYGVRKADPNTPGAKDEYMVASESIALDLHHFELLDDVAPGEAIIMTNDRQLYKKQCAEHTQLSPCVFEFVYFARPDSMIDDVSVYKARLRMGEKLAERIKERWANEDIDVVIPIPESSRTSAIPMAHELGVKFREGFVKNRYIGRTFIMPGQEQRVKSVRRKLNAVELEFRNKNVLLIDDSIVRGTTSKQIIQMAREAGAKKVFFASAAPPVRYPNVYGIDMPVAEELVAHNRTEAEICEILGADGLIYQTLEDLEAACLEGNPKIDRFDSSCFSNEYVTDVGDDYFEKIGIQRSDMAKQHNG